MRVSYIVCVRPFPSKKYQIIYADPPWKYGSPNSPRSPERHYHTMTNEEICRLPLHTIKTEHSVCLMWATFPKLEIALHVLHEWGFLYKTVAFVWIKKNRRSDSLFWGMGNYTRSNAEICLLGISPGVRTSECVISHRVHQVVISPIESHSKKPEIVKARIVELFGSVSRIELFARKQTSGWDVWGDETDKFPAS